MNMLHYTFMIHAFIAGIIIATTCGVVSVFAVIRKTVFATHALSHISITGSAVAALFNFPVFATQAIINLLCAIVMGILGDKFSKNDINVGVVLVFTLGIGVYCLSLLQNNSGVVSILFGNILAISLHEIWVLLLVSIFVVSLLLILWRIMVFASLDPIIAQSKNIPIKFVSVIFFILLALTVSQAIQIVGALLVFSLLVIPGAIANHVAGSIRDMMLFSIISANIATILALIVSFYFNIPVSFLITAVLSIIYMLAYLFKHYKE